MKLNLKSVAVAVALAGAAAGAHASAISTKPSTGNSSLVLTVFDATAGKSYFAEIGGAGTLNSINTGTFSMSGLSGLFTGDPSNIFWSVVAGDTTLDAGASFVFGQRLLATSLTAPSLGGVNGQMPGLGATNLETFDSQACGAIAAGSPCIANTATDATYAGVPQWNADFGGNSVLSGNFLSAATSMALWLMTPDSSLDEFSAFLGAPVATQTAYTAAINLANGTITISSDGGTPEVPLPAAVWLFGSALGAMGIIGRRRKAIPA